MQQIIQETLKPETPKPETINAAQAPADQRKRVEAVVETLAALRSQGESLQEVAHDARNMVTALGLYCDLLQEPGVLATPFVHYGSELRLVAAASRRLVEKLVAIDTQTATGDRQPSWFNLESSRWPMESASEAGEATGSENGPGVNATGNPNSNPNLHLEGNRLWDSLPAVPVSNLAAELVANRNLLSALAGPQIALTVDTVGGALPVHLTGEDLTRILVNLVKNAAEAMHAGGRIHLSLCDRAALNGALACVALVIEDNGPGIPGEVLERIFTSGYSTRGTTRVNGRSNPDRASGGWPVSHRGLGLAITRSIVEAAGGRVLAANRQQGGARFEIELPVRTSAR